jgi:hypothetical protein
MEPAIQRELPARNKYAKNSFHMDEETMRRSFPVRELRLKSFTAIPAVDRDQSRGRGMACC